MAFLSLLKALVIGPLNKGFLGLPLVNFVLINTITGNWLETTGVNLGSPNTGIIIITYYMNPMFKFNKLIII